MQLTVYNSVFLSWTTCDILSPQSIGHLWRRQAWRSLSLKTFLGIFLICKCRLFQSQFQDIFLVVIGSDSVITEGWKNGGKNISDYLITCTTDWRQHRQLGWRRQRARAVLGSVNVPEMKNDHGDRSLQHGIIITHGNDHFTTITFRAATGVLLNIDHTLTEWPNIDQF